MWLVLPNVGFVTSFFYTPKNSTLAADSGGGGGGIVEGRGVVENARHFDLDHIITVSTMCTKRPHVTYEVVTIGARCAPAHARATRPRAPRLTSPHRTAAQRWT